jgi:hypothetical protein
MKKENKSQQFANKIINLDKLKTNKISEIVIKLTDENPEIRQSSFEELLNFNINDDIKNYFYSFNEEKLNNLSLENEEEVSDKSIISCLNFSSIKLDKIVSDSVEFSLEYCINFLHMNKDTLLNKFLIPEIISHYSLEDIYSQNSDDCIVDLTSLFKNLNNNAYKIITDVEIKNKCKELISHVFELMCLTKYETEYQDMVIEFFSNSFEISKQTKQIILLLQINRNLLSDFGFEIYEIKRLLNSLCNLSTNNNMGVKNELSELFVEFITMYEFDERLAILSKLEKKLDLNFYVSKTFTKFKIFFRNILILHIQSTLKKLKIKESKRKS